VRRAVQPRRIIGLWTFGAVVLADLANEFSIRRELQKLVAVVVAADPDIAVLVDMQAVLVLDPFLAGAGATPVAQQLPSASNSITGGAALQHLVCGGLACAPFSSSSRLAGRCKIQMRSSGPTAMPATCPRTQFSGSGFGQNGSGWNVGGASALAPC